MRNSTLQTVLESFTRDAAGRLSAETAGGAEVSFELIEERGGSARLYCYRPLTGAFIHDRLGSLTALPSYAPAARALADIEGVGAYLQLRGEPRVPGEPRERADVALQLFLAAVFEERSQFGFDRARFEAAYAELERMLYEGRRLTTVIAPLLGIGLEPDTDELALAEGLSLVRGQTLAGAPTDAVWGEGDEPNVLAMLSVLHDHAEPPPLSQARSRFRRILTALRLFERGAYALGPVAWTRLDEGAWRRFPLGGSARPRFVTLISSSQEDELRGFFNLIAKRAPATGQLSWALARFEMGCERPGQFQALSDYLLALRALLEPEGPSSGYLPRRLAAICATPDDRSGLIERTLQAAELERKLMDGGSPGPGEEKLVEELSENLRAVLRDMVCGHLDADIRAVADELLGYVLAAEV